MVFNTLGHYKLRLIILSAITGWGWTYWLINLWLFNVQWQIFHSYLEKEQVQQCINIIQKLTLFSFFQKDNCIQGSQFETHLFSIILIGWPGVYIRTQHVYLIQSRLHHQNHLYSHDIAETNCHLRLESSKSITHWKINYINVVVLCRSMTRVCKF
jgi:hypothetical protein